MNQLKALLTASAITALVACAMLAIGVNAARNMPAPAAAPVSANASVVNTNSSASNPAEIQQLRDLVNQYQTREQQYQQQLNDLNQQLDQASQQLQQANQEVDQYNQVMQALQRYGLIQVTADGRIRIRRGGDDGGSDE